MKSEKFFGLDIFDLDSYIQHRSELVKEKSGAVTIQFNELDGTINITKFSKRFFGKSHSWFSQRLHGSLVMKKEQSFKEEEYNKIAEGFRELAKQLNQYADEIERAKNE